MRKERLPEYKPTLAFQAIADAALLREISGRGPDNRVVFAIKVKPILSGQSLTQVEEAINAAGKANGVIVDGTRPYDTEKRVLYLDGPLQHVADIATQFGSKAGRNIHALLEANRSPA